MRGKRVPVESVLEKITNREITLIVETYKGVGYKAKFVDKDFGEFWVEPRFVLKGASHPVRAEAKRRQTLMARYGTLCAASNPLVITKYREDYLYKHGVDHPMRNEAVKLKAKNTNIEKYGAISPLANKDVQDKIKGTLSERYGVKNAFQIPAVMEKIDKTNTERHGFSNPSQSPEIKLKIIKSRYGQDAEIMDKHIANIVRNTRARVSKFISSCSSYTSNEMLLLIGCDKYFILDYLESKFQPGMSWDNYGKYGWHIDHVYPLGRVAWDDPIQVSRALHYTNLQPLWAKDNLSKGCKII